jgi:hypothetical protein
MTNPPACLHVKVGVVAQGREKGSALMHAHKVIIRNMSQSLVVSAGKRGKAEFFYSTVLGNDTMMNQ